MRQGWRAYGWWLLAAAGGTLLVQGCGNWPPRLTAQPPRRTVSPATQPVAVPAPLSLLLPHAVRIHPFTGTRTFHEKGIKGIDVRIEVLDAYGDSTKAFGDFRFEAYAYQQRHVNRKGARMGAWQESLLDPKQNLVHWDRITRAYEFKLQWDRPIAVGDRFVLAVVFSSPYSQRLFHERVFVAGQ